MVASSASLGRDAGDGLHELARHVEAGVVGRPPHQRDRLARQHSALLLSLLLQGRVLVAQDGEPPDLVLRAAVALGLGGEVFLRQSSALRDRPDQCETLRAFDGPALILCGESDKPCPRDRHELMAELIPRATLQIIEKAGHLTTLEKPDATNAALARWLEE